MQKSGTKKSLFRLRLRLLHAILDVVLIVCLVIFFCSMTCLKWLILLNEHLKKNHALFLLYGSIYLVFSFDALFGLTWCMLTTCLTLTSRHKPIWSFVFLLVMPFYAFFYDVLSLCMIIVVIALLVGRTQSFASLRFVLSMSSTRASNSQKPSLLICPPYIPTSNLLCQSIFDLLLSILRIKLFLVLCEN
jgi:hypothetical protein